MLMDLSGLDFTDAVAAQSPAPGGGSVAAYMGACGAALMEMVCRLSLRGKEQGDDFTVHLLAMAGEKRKELQALVDEDTAAYSRVMQALKLPKGTPEEKDHRREMLTAATFYAADVPMRTARTCTELISQVAELMKKGNQNALSDAAVGLECLHAACRGACCNVRINLGSLTTTAKVDASLDELKDMESVFSKCYLGARELLKQKGL